MVLDQVEDGVRSGSFLAKLFNERFNDGDLEGMGECREDQLQMSLHVNFIRLVFGES